MKLRGIYELNNNNIVKESHSDLFWFMWSRTLDNINAGIITNQGICVRYQCVAIEYRANYTGNKLLELIYRDEFIGKIAQTGTICVFVFVVDF